MQQIDTQPQMRRRVVSLDLSLLPYAELREQILAAAVGGESRTACFANVHMVIEAQHNPDLARAVNGADWVCADGVPLLWSLKQLYGVSQERLAGMDLMPSLLEGAAERGLPVYFYGSTDDELARAVAVCAERYPSLRIAGTYSPPFRPLTALEEKDIAARLGASGAKLVFVALGCPKQELFMARLRNMVPAVMLGIGGALPILTGSAKLAPEWIRRSGIEWLFRLAQEPRRLFKRYFTTNPLFIWALMKQINSK
ncbi:WecB/TagA/CpsF family glycosyltransferase [Fibrella aquatilis]|uniref:WecB/TagA/CpsF family glycosyltransferase n=1 Tax=Fibrella aquatilis TaxID=2817059 RepID=A0A939G8L6_9BACT|nr:WecB/TagA/CpsF family glycosyltransferase [Fibrella aquatilis]MBO0932076.1 WecB/TagA/CpsF family glycosyltransferase [Fibrella aquatilis]